MAAEITSDDSRLVRDTTWISSQLPAVQKTAADPNLKLPTRPVVAEDEVVVDGERRDDRRLAERVVLTVQFAAIVESR